jgi:cytochrome c peroxidase
MRFTVKSNSLLTGLSKCCILLLSCCITFSVQSASPPDWSEAELALLRLQWINNLPALAPDPSNKYADNPVAAKLGQKLFFDKQFSGNGKVACASCHAPEKAFTDGLAKSQAMGETARSAPGLLGVAFSPWFFWDGRSDSLWSQALGPLEAAVEHGGNRLQYARIIYNDPVYKKQYEDLFEPLPDFSDLQRFPIAASPVGDQASIAKWHKMSKTDRTATTRIFVNIGKSIAAYESMLKPGASRFDEYVEAILNVETGETNTENILTIDEISGLKLFIGKAMCVTCHQGPLFTNHGFHNVAAPDPAAIKPEYTIPLFYALMDKPAIDRGRLKGVQQALESEFNCFSQYSDAVDNDCAELKYVNKRRNETLAAFKVPTLRNISKTAPYMHAGQFSSLPEVLKHYNSTPSPPAGHSELMPIKLKDRELKQIEAFLYSLDSPPAVADELLRPPGD